MKSTSAQIDRWRMARHDLGLSWRELSQQTQVPVSTLFGWLEEGRRMSVDGAAALERVLGPAKDPIATPPPYRKGIEINISFGDETIRIVRLPLKMKPYP
jgi:hypothetical protein